jgi:hypothetical protein
LYSSDVNLLKKFEQHSHPLKLEITILNTPFPLEFEMKDMMN